MRIYRNPAAAMLVAACLASAGIHIALVPQHLVEEPPLGYAFIATAVALLAAGAAVTLRPSRPVAMMAAGVLASVLLAYVASRTTTIPMLDPEREAVDVLGSASVGIELVGMAAALWMARVAPTVEVTA